MAIIEILKMGHPQLRRRSDAVAAGLADSLHDLVADMADTMEAYGGVGIAAPQIGVSLCVVVIDSPPLRFWPQEQKLSDEELTRLADGPSVLINPRLKPVGDEIEYNWEGCLSLPGLRGLVPRYKCVEYRFQDMEGRIFQGKMHGIAARVLQHECDHLEGILYPERMDDLNYLIYESEMRHYYKDNSKVRNDAGNR